MNNFTFPENQNIKQYILTIDQLKFDQVIGSGGFGEVSIGHFIPTGQKVAIKKLHTIENNQRNRALYDREVTSLANHRHRFLLPFIGFTQEAPFCIVTKYIPNGSLYKILHCEEENGVELTPTQLTMIAYGISSGMKYLHSKKIIHRDLKTQNILLDEHYFPIIADFGSSRKHEMDQPMTGLFGTTNYMAPEFIQGEEYNEKVDVYSFGLILWEMLTNSVPFQGLESAQVIYTVVVQQSRPPIPENTPPYLSKLIMQCWSPDPNERPSFEKIVPLFEKSVVEFQGTDRNLLKKLINQALPQIPLKLRTSNTNLLKQGSSDNEMGNLPRDNSSFKSSNHYTSVKNLTEKANESLYALNQTNPAKIQKALDFFLAVYDDPNVPSWNVWPQFLKFICGENPPELIEQGEALCLQFAKTYDVLKGISNVADLENFVQPNTLDIFLYVITNVQNIDVFAIVKRLYDLFDNQTCSQKAITLVCKAIQNSLSPTMTKAILAKLKEVVLKYINTSGGNLIIETLVFYQSIDSTAISAYGQSTIPENVVAAYHALFATNNDPNLFSLDLIISHITSEYENLREVALEHIRRFTANTINYPLLRIVIALFEATIKYESEKASLLLVRIAMNPDTCLYIIKSGYLEQWMNAKPSVCINLLKLFIACIKTNKRAKVFLFQQKTLLATFFASVLIANDKDADVAGCWAISMNEMTLDFATALISSNFLSMLCDLITKEDKEVPKRYVHFLNVLTMIAPHVYYEKYNPVIETLMNMIEENSPISYYCIISLAALSAHVETHDTFLNNNRIFQVINAYTDKGESSQYQQKLFDNLTSHRKKSHNV